VAPADGLGTVLDSKFDEAAEVEVGSDGRVSDEAALFEFFVDLVDESLAAPDVAEGREYLVGRGAVGSGRLRVPS
jgi:hypothetical protein